MTRVIFLPQKAKPVIGWQRPTDWLPMPASQADRVNILVAVYDHDSNFCAFSATIVGGYTVDWGDGTVENVASGAQAQHNYLYSAVAGTDSTLGYRQAIIKIYPQAANSFTSLDFSKRHTSTTIAYTQQLLDIEINTSALTALSFSGTVICGLLKRCVITAIGEITSAVSMFSNCTSLQSITFPKGSGASLTTANSMFLTCNSLIEVNLPSGFGSALTTATNFMSACFSLTNLILPTGFGRLLTVGSSMLTALQSLTTMTFPPEFGGALTNATNMFNGLKSYTTLTLPPGFGLSITDMTSMFSGFNTLEVLSFPAGFGASVTTTTTAFATCTSLSKISNLGLKVSFSLASCKLSKKALEEVFTSLGKGTGQTITISSNWGADTALSLTGTGTAGTSTIAMADTTGINNGMQISGTNTPLTTPVAVTFTDAGDLVNFTAHGLQNGDPVAFPSITTTTGIVVDTTYYVVNAAINSFQVAATASGAALPLTTNGTGTIKYPLYVASFVANTSVTTNRPLPANLVAETLAFRILNTSIARLKGWTITG